MDGALSSDSSSTVGVLEDVVKGMSYCDAGFIADDKNLGTFIVRYQLLLITFIFVI